MMKKHVCGTLWVRNANMELNVDTNTRGYVDGR